MGKTMMLLLIGMTLTAVTVAVHAAGTTFWIKYLASRVIVTDEPWTRSKIWSVLISTAVVMLLLHVAEVWLWAGAYRIFVPGELETLEEALYFSFVTFTSLGYGDITLDSNWRVLSGVESLCGLLVAGFSTALLFSVLQRAWTATGASPRSAPREGESR